MTVPLSEVEQFGNDDAYRAVRSKISELVQSGILQECGLDPSAQGSYVGIYRARNGEEWHLSIPDHAYRGFLRQVRDGQLPELIGKD